MRNLWNLGSVFARTFAKDHTTDSDVPIKSDAVKASYCGGEALHKVVCSCMMVPVVIEGHDDTHAHQ